MGCGAARPALPFLQHAGSRRGALLHELRRLARRGARRRAGVAEPPPEERRQVTVLFADLSGYTAFAERMDPEAVKSLVDRALMRLGREVERYGGTVDKYIGDNVMALFGAPVAHEDDAERAVRAGLGMQAAMEEVNAGLPRRNQLRPARGRQHRRGARGRRRRGVHRRGRHRERRLAAAERRPSGQRHRRRAHHAGLRDSGQLRAARAAAAEGEGSARAGLGGRLPDRRAGRRPRRSRSRVSARRPRRRAEGARDALRARSRGEAAAAGHADRRGGRRQVAGAARVRAPARPASLRAVAAHRALSPLRHRNRLLGARRGAAAPRPRSSTPIRPRRRGAS